MKRLDRYSPRGQIMNPFENKTAYSDENDFEEEA